MTTSPENTAAFFCSLMFRGFKLWSTCQQLLGRDMLEIPHRLRPPIAFVLLVVVAPSGQFPGPYEMTEHVWPQTITTY